MGDGKPKPRIDSDNAPYFEASSAGRFVIQRCQSCGKWTFFPRSACPECLSDDLKWMEASGRGELLSFCVVQRPHHPSFYDEVPILFAAVKLAEGPVMLTELRGVGPTALKIGMPLRVEFSEIDESLRIPVWAPLDARG
jgi:uncharacterized protein